MSSRQTSLTVMTTLDVPVSFNNLLRRERLASSWDKAAIGEAIVDVCLATAIDRLRASVNAQGICSRCWRRAFGWEFS